jgi:predicted O-linked N-acetylglucosamine transferase (SPINDLY family)
LGLLLAEQGQYAEASNVLARAVRLAPKSLNVRFNLGGVLKRQQRYAEAEVQFRTATELAPARADAYLGLGEVLVPQGRLEEAAVIFGKALALDAKLVNAHFNLAAVLVDLRRYREAVKSLQSALELQPKDADALALLGRCLLNLGQRVQAIECFRRAGDLAPKSAAPLVMLGSLFRAEGRLAEARDVLEQSVSRDGKSIDALLELVWVRRQLAEWGRLGELERTTIRVAAEGAVSVSPFPLLLTCDDPALQHAFAKSYSERAFGALAPTPVPAAARSGSKIRIGYFSGDFDNHAKAYACATLLERHDRDRFEVHAFALRAGDNGAVRQRIEQAADRFHDVSALETGAIVERARAEGIDIAVDLNGYSAGARASVLARRIAPIQASYAGYPGTLGSPSMDYLIADAFVVAAGSEVFFSEKIVRLPHGFLPNDLARLALPPPPSRVACGLPEAGFVFATFLDVQKITPSMFDSWMRLLTQVPGSAMWLGTEVPAVQANLRREAIARGVEASRIIFRDAVNERVSHLALYRLADLFLDCQPFSAGSEASDALWAGLPLVTCAGRGFASRVAGSVLTTAGLPELVTNSLAEYETLALKLAREPDALEAVKGRVRTAKASALFDPARLTRHLEVAYAQMHAIAVRGEAPRPFDVADMP